MLVLKQLVLLNKLKLEILLALIVAFIAISPHLFAYLVTPRGYYFTGVNTNGNLNDIQGVYLPAIRNFSKGDWLYRNPFDGQLLPFFHYPVYLVLGKIAQLLHLQVWIAYVGSIFVLSVAFCLFVFKFLNSIFVDNYEKFLAFALIVFGGLFTIIPEISGLVTLQFPHFVVATLAILCFFYTLFSIEKQKLQTSLFITCLSSFLISITHPWMMLPLCAIALIWSIYIHFSCRSAKKVFICFFAAGVIAVPFLLYFGSTQRVPWVFFELPTRTYYSVLVLGFLLPLGLLGLVRKYKSHTYFAIWVVVQLAFGFLPVPFQSRFLEGIYFPLAIFVVFGIEYLVTILKLQSWKFISYCFIFAFLSFGSLSLFLMTFLWLPNRQVYKSLGEEEAFSYLDKIAGKSQIVLSLANTGNYMAGVVGATIYVGHGIQTRDYFEKRDFARRYYSGDTSLKNAEQILKTENICYVYLGPLEKSYGGWVKGDYLLSVFNNSMVEIYKTTWCGL